MPKSIGRPGANPSTKSVGDGQVDDKVFKTGVKKSSARPAITPKAVVTPKAVKDDKKPNDKPKEKAKDDPKKNTKKK
jgi:hypothetical protein